MRSASTYGHWSIGRRWPGISLGRMRVSNRTNRALDVGSKRLIRSPSGKPTHGTTIDHASTQRSR